MGTPEPRLSVNLVTQDACAGPSCEACQATVRLFKEAASSAIGMEFGLRRLAAQGRPVSVDHVTCQEAAPVCEENSPPLVLLDGEVILTGGGWTVAALRDSLREHKAT